MTTNLTTRSAQADTITAVPLRTVARGTQTNWLTRLLLLALMAVLSIPMAQAQLIYTYNGNDFSQPADPMFGTKITVTISVPAPIPPNLPFGGGQCGVATITDGVHTFTPLDCRFKTDAYGHIYYWTVGYDAYPYLLATHSTLNSDDESYNFFNGSGNFIYDAPGTWVYPTAFSFTNWLLGAVNAINIQKQGTRLIDQLTTVLTDINNGILGLACSDLQIFASHVKAQTGKAITTAQATTIMQWVAAISASIPNCQVN